MQQDRIFQEPQLANIYSNGALWHYGARVCSFETLGGNNSVDTERQPIQTTKECSPSLLAAAFNFSVVGCVITPQLQCLCLCRFHVCVPVYSWQSLVTTTNHINNVHSQLNTSGSERREEIFDKGRIPCLSLLLMTLPPRSMRERRNKSAFQITLSAFSVCLCSSWIFSLSLTSYSNWRSVARLHCTFTALKVTGHTQAP